MALNTFFSALAETLRSDPLRSLGTGLKLASLGASFIGKERGIDATSNVVALNNRQIQELAPLQVEAVDDQIESAEKVARLDKRSADRQIAFVREEADRVVRGIALRNMNISGGVPIPSNIPMDDILSDTRLEDKSGNIVRDLGELGELRREKRRLEGERAAQFSAGGVRAGDADFEDIDDASSRRLQELSLQLEDLELEQEQADAQLKRSNEDYLDELEAINMQLETQKRVFENTKKQILKRAEIAGLDAAATQDALDAEGLGNIADTVISGAGLLTGDNPIGNALAGVARNALGSLGGGGAGTALTTTISGVSSPTAAGLMGSPFSGGSVGGIIPGGGGAVTGLGAGAAVGGAGAGGVSMAGIPSLGGMPGFASAAGGLSAALPILGPAAFVGGAVFSKLMGGDSTKEQMFMGIEGVRQYDPDFDFTGDDAADLQRANRIAYLAPAPRYDGKFQNTKISAKYQQRFGLPAIATPDMFEEAAATSLGRKIIKGKERARFLEISNIGGGGEAGSA